MLLTWCLCFQHVKTFLVFTPHQKPVEPLIPLYYNVHITTPYPLLLYTSHYQQTYPLYTRWASTIQQHLVVMPNNWLAQHTNSHNLNHDFWWYYFLLHHDCWWHDLFVAQRSVNEWATVADFLHVCIISPPLDRQACLQQAWLTRPAGLAALQSKLSSLSPVHRCVLCGVES